MPSKIPVHIGHHEFRSMNKARLHYREILYKYEVGSAVNDVDKQQVLELVDSAAVGCPAPSSGEEVRVVKGSYGRRCFEVRADKENSHLVSIMRSVKGCTVPSQEASHSMPCSALAGIQVAQTEDKYLDQNPKLALPKPTSSS